MVIAVFLSFPSILVRVRCQTSAPSMPGVGSILSVTSGCFQPPTGDDAVAEGFPHDGGRLEFARSLLAPSTDILVHDTSPHGGRPARHPTPGGPFGRSSKIHFKVLTCRRSRALLRGLHCV
eukprot:TRINITY_DN1044_c1_g2_i1.p3 TRINITY_DN1044_c1_g2~~TRINITY_DN1044_c1_g2_i1.p3  ORF type:complete len:121 (+),score=3.64 TRINITY_DN1044_c1_g2_i1:436-798(+)